jgi:hypothetical protein
MSGKDTARKILSQLFNSNIKPQSNIIKVEARFIEDLTPEVKNELVKIAYNTYVKKSDLSRVWTIERIDGKDYVVAVDSGRQLSYNYDIKHSDSDIQIVRGDEVLASFPVDELTDVKGLASFLKNKAAMYKFLPGQLFVQAMRNDFESFKKVFISSNALMRKSAEDAEDIVQVSPETRILNNNEAIDFVKKIMGEEAEGFIDKLFIRKTEQFMRARKDLSNETKQEIINKLQQRNNQIKSEILTIINTVIDNQRKISDANIEPISLFDNIIFEVTDILNKVAEDADFNILPDYADNLKILFSPEWGGIPPIFSNVISKYSEKFLSSGQSNKTKDTSKENRQKVKIEVRTEKERIERDVRSRSGKILGYIEGANSYSKVLQRLEDERKKLKDELNSVIKMLSDYVHIDSTLLEKALEKLLDVFVQRPLDITKEQLKSAIDSIYSDQSKSIINSLPEDQLRAAIDYFSKGKLSSEIKSLSSDQLKSIINSFFEGQLENETLRNAISSLLEDRLNALVDMLSTAFNQKFFDTAKMFFNEVGLYKISRNLLSDLFYQFSDEKSMVFLDADDIPDSLKDYVPYVKDFNELAKSNEKFDVVLSDFLDKYPNINTKEQIIKILNVISEFVHIWEEKAIKQLYMSTALTNVDIQNYRLPNTNIYELMYTSSFIEDLFTQLIGSLSVKAREFISKMPKLDLTNEKDFEKLEKELDDSDRKNLMNFILRVGFLGHALLLQTLAVIPHRLIDASFGSSIREDLIDAITSLKRSQKYPKPDIYQLNKATAEGSKEKLNPVGFSVLIQLLKIHPNFIFDRIKNGIKNPLNILNWLEEFLHNELDSLIRAFNSLRASFENLKSTSTKPNNLLGLLLDKTNTTKKVLRALPLLAMGRGLDPITPNAAVSELSDQIFSILSSEYEKDRKSKLTDVVRAWEKKYNTTVDKVFGADANDLLSMLVTIDITISSVPDLKKNAHWKFIQKFVVDAIQSQQGEYTLIGIPNIMMALSHQTGFVESLFGTYTGPISSAIMLGANTNIMEQQKTEQKKEEINLGTPTSIYSSGERKNPIILSRKLYEITGFPNYFIENYLLTDKELKKTYDYLSKGIYYYTKKVKDIGRDFKYEWDALIRHIDRLVTPETLKDAYAHFLLDLQKYLPEGVRIGKDIESDADVNAISKTTQTDQTNLANKSKKFPGILSPATYNAIKKEKDTFKYKLAGIKGEAFLNDIKIAFTSALHTEILGNQPKTYEKNEDILYFKAKLIKLLKQSSSSRDPLSLTTTLNSFARLLDFAYHCTNLFPPMIKTAAKKNKNINPVTPVQSTPVQVTQAPTTSTNTGALVKYIFQAVENAGGVFKERMQKLVNTINRSARSLVQLANHVNLFGRHYGSPPAMLFDYTVTIVAKLLGFKDSHLESGVPQLALSTQHRLHKLLTNIIEYGNSPEGRKEFFKFLRNEIVFLAERYKSNLDYIEKKLKEEVRPAIQDAQNKKNTEELKKWKEEEQKLEKAKVNINKKLLKIENKILGDIDTILNPDPSKPLSDAEISSILQDISVNIGIPEEVKIEAMTPDLYLSKLLPEQIKNLTLKIARLLEKLLRIDSQLIDSLANVFGTIVQMRATISLAEEKITATSKPMNYAQASELSQFYPLSPISQMRAYLHTSPGIYVLSDGFIRFLRQRLPKDLYDTLVKLIVERIRNGSISSRNINARLSLLTDIFPAILRDHLECFQHDISTLFYLLEIDDAAYAPLVEGTFRSIAGNLANTTLFRDIDMNVDKDIRNKRYNVITNYYYNILMKYLRGAPTSYTILLNVFEFVRDELRYYVKKEFGEDVLSQLDKITFTDHWQRALKNLERALTNPDEYSSRATPYLIRSEFIEENKDKMKGTITIDDLNTTFSYLSKILHEKSVGLIEGKSGTIGSTLSALLYSGTYSILLKEDVDKLTRIVLPKIMEKLDQNDVQTHFPPDQAESDNYGRTFNLYLFREYMSGFIISLFGILVDSYSQLYTNYKQNEIDSKKDIIRQELANDLAKSISSSAASKPIIDIILDVLFNNSNAFVIFKIRSKTEKEPEPEMPEYLKRFDNQNKFSNYKNMFSHPLMKISETSETGNVQETNQDINSDVEKLKIELEAESNSLFEYLQETAQLLDEIKQINEEIDKEVNELEAEYKISESGQ